MERIFLAFLIVTNLATLILYGVDKYNSKKGKRRISEKTLLITSVFGPFGAFVGMYQFRHKTQKFKFYITVFLLCLLQFAIFFLLFYSKYI